MPYRIASILRHPRGLMLLVGGGVLLFAWFLLRPADSVGFVDVTEQAGIRFRHHNGAAGRKLLPETMGSGVVAFDYDADGFTDLFFVNSTAWPGDPPSRSPCMLYRNRGNGTFEDVSSASGLALELFGMGAAAGDFDNDGFPDLLITAIGGLRLLHNVPRATGRQFVDITLTAGISPNRTDLAHDPRFWENPQPIPFPTSAVWFDYNGDGKLDFFVCHYVEWSPIADLRVRAILSNGQRAYVPPTQFGGTMCQLFRNIDGTRFEDVSEQVGIRVVESRTPQGGTELIAKSLGVSVFDFDRDGWLDIVVANDTVRNFFFHNRPGPHGQRLFVETALPNGLAYSDGRPRGGMGIDTAELRPDEPTVLIANFTNEPNSLFRTRPTDRMVFSDVAMSNGLAAASRGPMKFGAMFFDFDRDGWLDVATCNGHLEPEIAVVQSGQLYAQPAQLFRFDGRQFREMDARLLGPDFVRPMVGRGLAYLDFDNDGDWDVVLTENNGPARLLENRTVNDHGWLKLRLVGDGQRVNREAIGAEVTVRSRAGTHRHTVMGSRGYLSQSQTTLILGLGQTTVCDEVLVRWPNSTDSISYLIQARSGETHTLYQPAR